MAIEIGQYEDRTTAGAMGIRCFACGCKISRGSPMVVRGAVYRAEAGESQEGEFRAAGTRFCVACAAPVAAAPLDRTAGSSPKIWRDGYRSGQGVTGLAALDESYLDRTDY